MISIPISLQPIFWSFLVFFLPEAHIVLTRKRKILNIIIPGLSICQSQNVNNIICSLMEQGRDYKKLLHQQHKQNYTYITAFKRLPDSHHSPLSITDMSHNQNNNFSNQKNLILILVDFSCAPLPIIPSLFLALPHHIGMVLL